MLKSCFRAEILCLILDDSDEVEYRAVLKLTALRKHPMYVPLYSCVTRYVYTITPVVEAWDEKNWNADKLKTSTNVKAKFNKQSLKVEKIHIEMKLLL